jgi:hypothetical protein
MQLPEHWNFLEYTDQQLRFWIKVHPNHMATQVAIEELERRKADRRHEENKQIAIAGIAVAAVVGLVAAWWNHNRSQLPNANAAQTKTTQTSEHSLPPTESPTPLTLPTRPPTELPFQLPKLSPTPNSSRTQSSSTPSAELKASGSETIALETNETKSAFNGEVLVSLIGVSYGGDPPTYEVTAIFGGPGSQNLRVEQQAIGSVAHFKYFEIRVISANRSGATFLVTNLYEHAR